MFSNSCGKSVAFLRSIALTPSRQGCSICCDVQQQAPAPTPPALAHYSPSRLVPQPHSLLRLRWKAMGLSPPICMRVPHKIGTPFIAICSNQKKIHILEVLNCRSSLTAIWRVLKPYSAEIEVGADREEGM